MESLVYTGIQVCSGSCILSGISQKRHFRRTQSEGLMNMTDLI